MKSIFFLAILFILTACAPGRITSPTATVIDLKDAVKTISAGTVLTLTANAPTKTPRPTATPLPTNTAIPTSTSTPAPEPISLTGVGDSVIDVTKWDGPALVRFTHDGQANFAVENYNGNKKIDLLVNTIGNYSGTRFLDFKSSQHTTRFAITADGHWTATILPLDKIRRESIPGTITGNGDDVLAIVGDNPDLLKSNYPGTSNYAIISFGYGGFDLVVNEIGPYSGTAIIPDGAFIFEITAEGPWTIEVTQK